MPTITRSRCGWRRTSARNVPPENSEATSAMTVTNTRKPANDAPMANASVPPPVPVSSASGAPPRRPMAVAVVGDENTDKVATSRECQRADRDDDRGAATQEPSELCSDDAGHRGPPSAMAR